MRDHVEFALLGAIARGQAQTGPQVGGAAEAVARVLDLCRSLDDERAMLYSDLLLASVSHAVREAVMTLPAGYKFQSELAIKNQAKGRAEGRAKGHAEDVVTVLETRGIGLTDEQRRRVLAITDLDVLGRMVRRAVTVATADELFE